jgi:PAS domain S-box-containing protein
VTVSRPSHEIGAAASVRDNNLTAVWCQRLKSQLAKRIRSKNAQTNLSPGDSFTGGGEMGERIRSFAWSKTVLGPIDAWPESLKTAVRICLGSRNPIVLWWGRSTLIQFYNDAFISFLGSKKHPAFLGRSGRECWSEIWETMGPMLQHVFATGNATWSEDFLYVLNRNLPREEGYFTFSYSPLWDDAGAINGIFCACYETTGRVIGDRRLRTLRDLGRTVPAAKTPEDACKAAANVLAGNPADVPFALMYLHDDEARQARLVATAGFSGESEAAPARIDLASSASHSVWPLKRVLDKSSTEIVSDLSTHFERLPGGPWPESPQAALVIPIAAGQSRPTGFLIAGLSPRRIVDGDYHSFFDLVVAHISTAIANANAYEQERERAEALAEIDRAKTLFFSNVSHEFRTPLTLMLAPLEDTLSARQNLTSEQRERLEVVHRNSLRLLKLVNTLLDFSRIEAGRIQASYQPTDLSALTAGLASVFRSLVERAGLRLKVSCPQLSKPVYVDREMWEKIVFNLISNAFKFTFAGEIEVAVQEVKGNAELLVRDTGTGIAPKDLPHLFERFYRVKGENGRTFEGSGIGLALVQELAKLHGGAVRVESQLGKGSTFVVSVPFGKKHLSEDRIGLESKAAPSGLSGEAYVREALRWFPGSKSTSDEEIQTVSSISAPKQPRHRNAAGEKTSRILLADDNADMRDYLHRLLLDEYEVTVATDGVSALESARQQRPDLVLADVMMPRLDGFGLLGELRADENLKTVPVLLVSARAGEESRIEALDAGADDYLVKPFSARELLARVGSHLAMAKMRQQAGELERRLRAEAEHRAGIVDSSGDAIISQDMDGTITSWNKAAEHIFGYPAQEAIGQNISIIVPPHRRDEESDVAARLRRGEGVDNLETVRKRKDGSLLEISVTVSPMKDASGRIVAASRVARDITERKRMESMSKEAELSGRLLQLQDDERRRVARELHDGVGQLLAALSMNTHKIANEKQSLSAIARRCMEETLTLIDQAISELRTISYLLHPPLLDEVGLQSALSEYVEGFGERSSISVSLDLPPEVQRLPRDVELSLFRIVQECLTNIHRHSHSAAASVRLVQVPGEIQLQIIDQGRGMSPEIQEKVFSGRNTGVGLRGMLERVRQIGGTLQIQSNEKGTSISVVVPIQDEGRRQPSTDEQPRAMAAGDGG